MAKLSMGKKTATGRWSWSTGERGARVRVYEREPGGILWMQASGSPRESLGHRDKPRARDEATRRVAQLRLDVGARGAQATLTVADALGVYVRGRWRGKALPDDLRTAVSHWTAVWGDRRVASLRLEDYEGWLDARLTGRLDGKGRRVPPELATPIKPKTAVNNVLCLRTAVRYCMRRRTDDGVPLLAADPTAGWPLPRVDDQHTPVWSPELWFRIRAAAERVQTLDAAGRFVPAPLPILLDTVRETGRRISAVLSLTRGHLVVERGRIVAVRWAPMKKVAATRVPLPAATADRLTAHARALGWRLDSTDPRDALLFPSPADAMKPIRYHTARQWLRRAAAACGEDVKEIGCFHALRRWYASARASHSLRAVMDAVGWKTERQALRYQHLTGEQLRETLEADPLAAAAPARRGRVRLVRVVRSRARGVR